MTNLQAHARKMLAVEQCDRDAAASVLDDFGMSFANDMRSGVDDCDFIVQAFARHRIAALQSRADESVEKSAILVAARAWWKSNMPNSTVRAINIGGDGRVKIAWRDAEEEGHYTLPVDFYVVPQSRADEMERLRMALVAAKREMWNIARQRWTLEDFKNWAVVQQIDAALHPINPALARTGGE